VRIQPCLFVLLSLRRTQRACDWCTCDGDAPLATASDYPGAVASKEHVHQRT
jgi:hypothetical protein